MSRKPTGSEKTYETVSLAERRDLSGRIDQIVSKAWPEFMFHDPVLVENWETMLGTFRDFQLLLLDDDELVAVTNAVPLHFDGTLDQLPDRGIDWGMETSIADHRGGLSPNALMGLQVVVDKNHRGQGWSAAATAEMIRLAARKGIDNVIIPVRPSQKSDVPLIAMADYVTWLNTEGLPHDSWLRVHARAGGEIIRVCPQSMRIAGTVENWTGWTGLKFPGSGRYVVPGALVPVDIDVERDEGLYVEPNVWIRHRVRR